MSRPINQTSTLTTHPTSIDNTHSVYPGTFYNNNDLDNCFTDASSSTRAAFYTTTGSRAVTQIYLNFDECADIPSSAIINSVSCSVKCGTQGTNYFSTRTVQMCTGTITKGSATTMSGSNSSPSTHTLSVGTWTASELQNAKLYFHIIRGTSNTTTDATFSIFGATLTVNYTVNGIAYTIAATSNVSGITASPSSQELMEGESGIVTINGSSINGLSITDNDVDISQLLVRKAVINGGTIEKYPKSATTSGIQSGSSYAQYAVGYSAENPSSSTQNMYASRNALGYAAYSFDFSDIPSNATITNVEVRGAGHRESSTVSSTYVARVALYSGSTQKGSNYELTNTSNYQFTVPDVGTWTRTELQDAKLRFYVGYYGGLLTGATWEVTYTVPSSGNEYYWEYKIENISADHVILIEEAGPIIPPEEDPTYSYYPITISSINAVTVPANGTTRVQEGTTQVITISPTDPQLTLALDNGVDITSQLQGGVPNNTYTIDTQVSGASYGFNLDSSTGYYVSTNNGENRSASVARLNMDFESECLVTIQYINYAEEDYDYGMFGKLDTEVATDGLTASSGGSSPSDSTSNYEIARCTNSTSTQTVTYKVPIGQHFIDIKYGKDDASESGYDSLQWRVLSVEATSAGGDYTYTLTNINQKHSLIFVFGNVDYYYITSSGNACKLYPDGQIVKLDGDSYRLTIIPNDPDATVSILDNGINRTSLLTREEGQDKNGNKIVNYIYSLSNINAAHTLTVTCSSSEQTTKIFFKNNSGVWTQHSKVFLKVNGAWVEQDASTWSRLFDTSLNYRIL